MATLKISDLSIGDYVCYLGRVYKVDSIEESGLVRANNKSYSCPHIMKHIDYIDPIPITAEILEKIGFVDKGSSLFPYGREWRGDKSTVSIHSFDEKLWFADFEFRDGRTCMSNIPLIYINQLQHVLSLMGVDKEINL